MQLGYSFESGLQIFQQAIGLVSSRDMLSVMKKRGDQPIRIILDRLETQHTQAEASAILQLLISYA